MGINKNNKHLILQIIKSWTVSRPRGQGMDRRALDGLQEIVVNYEPHGSLQILPHVA